MLANVYIEKIEPQFCEVSVDGVISNKLLTGLEVYYSASNNCTQIKGVLTLTPKEVSPYEALIEHVNKELCVLLADLVEEAE